MTFQRGLYQNQGNNYCPVTNERTNRQTEKGWPISKTKIQTIRANNLLLMDWYNSLIILLTPQKVVM